MIHINPVSGLHLPALSPKETAANSLPQTQRPAAPKPDRWSILTQVVIARDPLGLTDRDITVLRALISCLPKNDPQATFVFASNRTLSARAEGMHERTLRRHLANLVRSGLVTKQNSPNLKRYVRRDRNGVIVRAFGFELSPLWARSPEICAKAAEADDEAVQVAMLREDLSQIRQHILKTPFSPAVEQIADDIRKACRRKLTSTQLRVLVSDLRETIFALSPPDQTEMAAAIMSDRDSQNVRHQQSSIKDISESEAQASVDPDVEHNLARQTEAMTQTGNEGINPQATTCHATTKRHEKPSAAVGATPSLHSVIEACPESFGFALNPVQSWYDLIRFSDLLAPMIRIGRDLLDQARHSMGAVETAVTVMCIVQMGARVRSPGAYLRSLCIKAAAGEFSPAAMVLALLRSGAKGTEVSI